jgi:hypothetical protein
MKIKLLDHKHIPGFNSGSGLQFHAENLYLTDPGSNEILVLSQNWKEVDRIPLFDSKGSPEQNGHKDLEAATIVEINSIPRLLALGTDINGTKHNKAVLLNLDDRTREDFTIDEFDERLKVFGLDQLNIRTAAIILGKLVLGNRGNAGTSENNFVVTDIDLWKKQDTEEISLLPVKYPDDTPEGILLSGMSYSPENDWLILTFISETAPSGNGGAAVTTSYLGLAENASRKVARKQVKINEFIDLAEVSKHLVGQQIKATCIQTDKSGKVKLYMVADHEEGGTQIFKIRIKH